MQMVLGVRDLPEAEVSLLRTIIRLSSDLAGAWRLGDSPEPCDVLLVNGAQAAAPSANGTSTGPAPARVIPVVRREEAAGGDVLHRPIRAEELIGLLNGHRCTWAETAPAELDLLLPAAAPAPAPAPATAPAPMVPAANAALAARLRRWPEWDFLRQHPAYLPLTTLLTKSALTAQELSVRGRQPLADCEALLGHLDKRRLIQWVSPAQRVAAPPPEAALAEPAPLVERLTPRAAPPSAAAESTKKRGLLSAIRRTLGL